MSSEEDKESSMIRRHSAYGNQPPWSRPKTGKRLTFADEDGDALYQVTYAQNTHYSRESGAIVSPSVRGCCVLQ